MAIFDFSILASNIKAPIGVSSVNINNKTIIYSMHGIIGSKNVILTSIIDK